MNGSHPPTPQAGDSTRSDQTNVGKIVDIRLTPLTLRFKVPYHWAGRVDLGAAVILVEVETDQGIVGIAEAAAQFPIDAQLAFLRRAIPVFLGQSPFDIERLFPQARRLCGTQPAPRAGHLALAGLEMAFWDAIGRGLGVPVYQLFGGAFRQEVDYFGFLQGDTADDLAADAERLVAADFPVIYLKVGRGQAADQANVAAIRQVIGDRTLRLDANEAWDVYTAIRMIRKLERFDPDWIEQPTPTENIAALRQVKEAVNIPIAADQATFTVTDVYEICRQQAADAVVVSPHETGGLINFRKAAAIAETAHIGLCLHGRFVSGITDLIQHHIALTLPNLTDGNQIMHQLLVEDLLAGPDITPVAGKLGVPDGPGFGFELDWAAVGRAAELYRENA